MFERILMPIDGSHCSDHAIAEGLELARNLDAAVTFLYVVENPVMEVYGRAYGVQFHEDLKHLAEETLEHARKRAMAADVTYGIMLVEDGHPVEAILKAEEDFDLVVMATHGRRAFDRMMMGSVTEGVLRRSQKPHLVLHCPKEDA